MAAQSTEEKLDKIKKFWETGDHYKLIYEWVKSGNLSKSEFEKALDMVALLEEDLSQSW